MPQAVEAAPEAVVEAVPEQVKQLPMKREPRVKAEPPVKSRRSLPEMSKVLEAMGGIIAELKTAVPPVKEWNMGMRIAVAAAVVVLFMTTYIIAQSHRLTNMLQALPPSEEMRHPAQPLRAGVAGEMGTDEGAAGEGVKGEAGPNGADNASGGMVAAAKYMLRLETPTTCSIEINHTPYGVLEGGKSMRVFLSPGSYTIRASTVGSHPSTDSRQVVVNQRNLNHWHKYRIRL
jgi:hypothetical protein